MIALILQGETAYDIAVARGRSEEITNLLAVPDAITKNREAIDKMEATLHDIL